jgi:hypothetical protein
MSGIIPFNSKVRDKITGFCGFVTVRIEYLNDCIRYGVQPPLNKKGKLPEEKVFDGPNLEIIALPKKGLLPTVETPNAFELGVKLEDKLSGLSGIAILRIKNRHSGDRYGIQPPMGKEEEIPEVKTFDEEDLTQIYPRVPKKKNTVPKPPNGPHDHNTAIAR